MNQSFPFSLLQLHLLIAHMRALIAELLLRIVEGLAQ